MNTLLIIMLIIGGGLLSLVARQHIKAIHTAWVSGALLVFFGVYGFFHTEKLYASLLFAVLALGLVIKNLRDAGVRSHLGKQSDAGTGSA